MANSYNGWPAHPDKNVIGVVQHSVYSGGLKAGDVTTVLQYVADQLAKRVEPVIPDHCWGYAYKTNANNASQLSCHASGTAIDFNAPAHPNGKANTFTAAQVKTIEAILAECGGAVKWLKGYDEMHFEIGVDAKTLAPIAARLAGGKPPAAATPPPVSTPPKDANDMADITPAQMDQIAKKVVDLLAARKVRINKVDEATGKETAQDKNYFDAIGDTGTNAARAAYRSR